MGVVDIEIDIEVSGEDNRLKAVRVTGYGIQEKVRIGGRRPPVDDAKEEIREFVRDRHEQKFRRVIKNRIRGFKEIRLERFVYVEADTATCLAFPVVPEEIVPGDVNSSVGIVLAQERLGDGDDIKTIDVYV